jgi:BirA family biotin operon repressor/biotin-[acetyl-CoA-carboxylase] ligase
MNQTVSIREFLEETVSTNSWLKEHRTKEDRVVWTDYQTAGRGCGSNSWESERGKNLLFSVLCHPTGINASCQFLLLEAMAVAVKEVVDNCIAEGTVTVKWPNDIYWNDRKLGGTLTECGLSGGHLQWCIIGTGINVNQTLFTSDAPNPVSLAQICGCNMEREPLLEKIIALFYQNLKLLEQGGTDLLQKKYMEALYRREGFHAYRDVHGTFNAEIQTVLPDGMLLLCDDCGQMRRYLFKEVQFIV